MHDQDVPVGVEGAHVDHLHAQQHCWQQDLHVPAVLWSPGARRQAHGFGVLDHQGWKSERVVGRG